MLVDYFCLRGFFRKMGMLDVWMRFYKGVGNVKVGGGGGVIRGMLCRVELGMFFKGKSI